MSALKSRKTRALLAGGVVLGIGASMTLAAWSDSEWAQGTFTTGSFTFHGSTTSATEGFADHTSSNGAAALNFTLDGQAMGGLKPGDTVTAPFWIKTEGSDATVTLSGPSSTGNTLGTSLDVSIVKGDCASTDVIASGKLSALDGGTVGTLTAGNAQQVCFKVTLPADYTDTTVQTTGPVAWNFTANA